VWGAAMVGVLTLLLLLGVRSDVVIGAWLAAFVAIPTQFSITNAAITRSALSNGGGDKRYDITPPGAG
jgi:hypothetical protein